MLCTPHWYDQIKKKVRCRACSTYGREESVYRILVESPEEEPDVGGLFKK